MGEFVRLETLDGPDSAIALIRLDRPPMNAISVAVQEELRAVATEAAERDDIRAVVVYGGEKVFAAGADVKEMAAMDYAAMVSRAPALSSAFTALARIPKPVVAAITGYALGGGCELALTADFRICADNAKLGQPELLLGIIPGAGGTQRLTRLVGPARAKQLIYSGRFVDAHEALSLGLVDQVVAPADVLSAAIDMVRPYRSAAAAALRAAKSAIDGGLDTDLDSGLRLESHLFAGLFGTADRTAGMSSFLDLGPGKATFTGR